MPHKGYAFGASGESAPTQGTIPPPAVGDDALEYFKNILMQRSAQRMEAAKVTEAEMYATQDRTEVARMARAEAMPADPHQSLSPAQKMAAQRELDAIRREPDMIEAQLDRPLRAQEFRDMSAPQAAGIMSYNNPANVRAHQAQLALQAETDRDNAGEMANLRAENPGQTILPPGTESVSEGGAPNPEYVAARNDERKRTIDSDEANYGRLVDIRDKDLGKPSDTDTQHLFYQALAHQAGDPYTLASQLAGAQAAERKRTLGLFDPSYGHGI